MTSPNAVTLVFFLTTNSMHIFTMTTNTVPVIGDSDNYLNRLILHWFQWHSSSMLASYRTRWAPSPDAPCCLWIGIPQLPGWVTATTTAHKAGGEPMNKMTNICDETGCWRGGRRDGISQLLSYWSYFGTLTVFPCCKTKSTTQIDFSLVSPPLL